MEKFYFFKNLCLLVPENFKLGSLSRVGSRGKKMKAWTFLLVAAELLNYLVLVSSSGFSDAKLARDYLESLNESAAVIANCGNVTHIGSNNHCKTKAFLCGK